MLKRYFIPHTGNGYKPHLFRGRQAAIVIAALVFFEAVFLIGTLVVVPSSGYFANIISSVLVYDTNRVRAASDVPPLTVNPFLVAAAQRKADDMAARGYFSHESPEGASPWQWMQEVGYQYASAGENLAVNFVDSDVVMQAWLSSESHRTNILNGNFTEIGVATARGNYRGREAIFVVQLFARPDRIAMTGRAVFSAPENSINDLLLAVSPAAAGIGAGQDNKPPQAAVIIEPSDGGVAEPVNAGAVENLFAKPRMVSRYIYGTLLVVALALLALTIFVEFRVQRPRLIVHGLLIVFVIAAAFTLNAYLVTSGIEVL
jgi:hypothetical protein